MTQDAWLTAHPYLRLFAEFHAQVEKAAAERPRAFPCIPNWHDYERDFQAGVPLLRSCRGTVDVRLVEEILKSLIAKLDSSPLPQKQASDIRDLHAELREHPRALQRAVNALLDRERPASRHSGLLWYLGWTVMAQYLSRVVDAFGEWRDEEEWLRTCCPTCGSLPAMAQLLSIDPERLRLLSCGCCRTLWRYRRTGCPFCENEDDHRLAILAVEGEECLRIDYCVSCSGYIKTYNGSGSESVMLADWTSLHLDVIAMDRGLNRSAASLYEL
jgi:FdhE protein